MARALLVLVLATAAAAQEARYRVSVNDGVATSTPNGARITAVVTTRDAGLDAVPAAAPSATTVVPPSTLTIDATPRPETAVALAGRGAGTTASADDALLAVDDAPPTGPLWEAFRARAASPYLVTDPEELLAGWRYFNREVRVRPTLPQDIQISNAVVDMIVSLDRAPKGDSRARPHELTEVRPERRTLVVRAGSGILSRTAPYGPLAAARYDDNATVTLTGKRSGPWYEVAGAPAHWVCGLWLEFKQP